ncbi:hypothetical protein V1512DRAFT_264349 [Lipomyces arxii]|uniref:uncharacterized protein n=1 Tax=Lipomyces arxii TaxID=56418 RepID=UPI0034CD1D9C
MIRKLLVLALASIASVSAQASACNESEVTITTQADLDNLASCSTFGGNIILAETLGSAALNGIQEIMGNLVCSNNTQIASISAPQLTTIGGAFTLNGLTILTDLVFPVLETVGSINWITLPAVSQLTFTNGVTNCSNVLISDTDLTTLDGINLSSVSNLQINNNLNLDEITMGLTSISYQADISYNGNTAVAFPDLLWAHNLTLQGISSISTPMMSVVNASYLLISNDFESFSAPNLTSVGGVAIEKNQDLRRISFPQLTTVGAAGIEIANNTDLESFTFPKVTSVAGAIILDGDFFNASFPALNVVRGAVSIDSEGDFDCSAFDSLNSSGNIRGNDYRCEAASSSTSVVPTSTAAATSSSAEATTTEASNSASTAASSSSAGAASTSSSSYALSGLVAIAIFLGIF